MIVSVKRGKRAWAPIVASAIAWDASARPEERPMNDFLATTFGD
jgi:hypothetical protein